MTGEFHVKLHLKSDIVLIASRFVRYRFSRAIKRGIPSSGNEFSYSIIALQSIVLTWKKGTRKERL